MQKLTYKQKQILSAIERCQPIGRNGIANLTSLPFNDRRQERARKAGICRVLNNLLLLCLIEESADIDINSRQRFQLTDKGRGVLASIHDEEKA